MKIKPKKLTSQQQTRILELSKGRNTEQLKKIWTRCGFTRKSVYDLSFTQARKLIEKLM